MPLQFDYIEECFLVEVALSFIQTRCFFCDLAFSHEGAWVQNVCGSYVVYFNVMYSEKEFFLRRCLD